MGERGLTLVEQLQRVLDINIDLNNQLLALRSRNRELVVEVMRMSAEASKHQEEIIRLNDQLAGIEELGVTMHLPQDEKDRALIEAARESRRLYMLIEIHMKQTGHNLCWMNDLRLWQEAFRDPKIEYPHESIPSGAEFVEVGCEEFCKPYYTSRFNPTPPPNAPSMPKTLPCSEEKSS